MTYTIITIINIKLAKEYTSIETEESLETDSIQYIIKVPFKFIRKRWLIHERTNLWGEKSPISAFRLEKKQKRNKTREILEENIGEYLYRFCKKEKDTKDRIWNYKY